MSLLKGPESEEASQNGGHMGTRSHPRTPRTPTTAPADASALRASSLPGLGVNAAGKPEEGKRIRGHRRVCYVNTPEAETVS